jgi:pyrroloquinoline quinone biosynthesis protein D
MSGMPEWRPALAGSIVLRRDTVQDTDLLVMPERVVVLNEQAGQILRLCDGSRTESDIVRDLAWRFPEAAVGRDVRAFLERVRKEGWLR